MSTRYAILIEDNDGNTVVSEIKQMEGGAPVLGGDHAKAVKVPDGVMIGMIKGGTVDAVGGYGFPDGTEGKALRSDTGVTKVDEPAKGKTVAKDAG